MSKRMRSAPEIQREFEDRILVLARDVERSLEIITLAMPLRIGELGDTEEISTAFRRIKRLADCTLRQTAGSK